MSCHGNTCVDKLPDCAEYTKSACQEPYVSWAYHNCPAFCGFCRKFKDPVIVALFISTKWQRTASHSTVVHFLFDDFSTVPGIQDRSKISPCSEGVDLNVAAKSCWHWRQYISEGLLIVTWNKRLSIKVVVY